MLDLIVQAPAVTRIARHRLLAHLHRGGKYAHLWTDAGNCSRWFRVDGCAARGERTIPRAWLTENIYFTVHPLTQIPPRSAGGSVDPRRIGSQLPYIAAINALFAEYDGKDYVAPSEYTPHLPMDFFALRRVEQRRAVKAAQERAFYADPGRYKQRAWAVIEALYYAPSVIVDSGGGYHCYWLLRNPTPIDDANRADVQAVQHGWVQMVGGDPGASDLRRLLRMPGTYNRKPGFGRHSPPVVFVKADFDRLYVYGELEEAVNDWLFVQRPSRLTHAAGRHRVVTDADDVRAAFDRQHRLVDLLMTHGYRVSYTTTGMTRMARPGRPRAQSSVTVFPARADGTPELSVHFSTNDELYCEEYVDPAGQIKRRAHDAFSVYVMLGHDGDWQGAYAAARKEGRQSSDDVMEESVATA